MSSTAQTLDRERFRSRLIIVLSSVVAVTVLIVNATAIVAFNRVVEPELANRTRLIGLIVRREIERVLELGIPFDAVAGLDSYLSDTVEDFDEVEQIAVTTTTGETLASATREARPSIFAQTGLGEIIASPQATFALPIIHGNELVGAVTIKTSPRVVQTRLRDVFLDVVVLSIVAILFAVELALMVAALSVGKPLDRVLQLLREQRAGDFMHRITTGGLGGLSRAAARFNDHAEDLAARMTTLPASARAVIGPPTFARIAEGRPAMLRLADISDIRLALFLLVAATEIAAAFLPLYARAANRPSWLSPELAGAVPLVFYLVAIALLSPFGRALVHRFGARRLFVASVPPTALALVFMGGSESLAAIASARGIVAVFYATATIACQEYAVRAGRDEGGVRAQGAFVAVVYGGLFCGSALGGVLAGRLGFAAAFYSGAVIAVLAGVVGALSMSGTAGDPGPAHAHHSEPTVSGVGSGLRFVALLFAIALPMNAATATVIWYLTPVVLADLGFDPAEIGRVVMLYYLAAVVLGPSIARLPNSGAVPAGVVGVGAMVSGVALLWLPLWGGFWALVAAVVGLGVGHTMIRAPLYAMSIAVTGGAAAAAGMLRATERIGAILGLVASALLLDRVGTNDIVLTLGIVVSAGALLYAVSEIAGRSRVRQ